MGIFSKQSRAKSQRSATTLIAKGCAINGQLKLESDIQIDGSVEGQIHVDKTIVISETGIVSGELFAEHLIINGEFEGTCHATKIEILSKGSVTGSIYSDDLSIEHGGRFNGVTYPAPEKQVVELKDVKLAAEA
ncbi:polymer-forming cytoskeletal family protein [Vibrio sp. 1180_3]|nr:polymer-forming cytoskeletal protein [Vibrio aestuarianus]MDE1330039.1 polymer-forming cytoskeletal protein [Vibrio aestuarianus]MDF9398576.1 polymer-forming cytoskeletal family protein [Vibrio sp. 1180_3]